MSEERLLVRERDEYGVIRVIESGDYRFLGFGDGVEQSCVFMPDPAWLGYDYIHAMLLGGLCHSQPRRALFLGFGAGSLTQACLRYLPLEETEAIELHPAIPCLAREHLGLRDDLYLRLRIGDALESLGECVEADLIFLDLYTDTSPSAAHLAWNFLGACQERLAEDSWLVINQWSGTNGKPLGAPLPRGCYHHHYRECPVVEGNVVVLVPANLALELDQEVLRTRAAALEPQLGYSLQGYINSLRPTQ